MSFNGKKSTVEEIIIKYKREPSLKKSIYVEGSTDKILIRWFLKQAKIHNIIVSEISSVTMNIQKVFDLGLDDNVRNRVITLTSLINDNIIGIIDSDFDFLKTSKYSYENNLLTTDYSCMEMYCFNEHTLEKILLGYAEAKQPSDFKSFKLMISNILKKLFIIRYAKDTIKKDLKYLNFNKELSLKSTTMSFNDTKYISKYLSNQKGLINNFNTFILQVEKTLPTDDRKVIHGHDFVEVLQFYLSINQGKNVFKRSLYSSLEYDKLKEEDLFKELLYRFV